MAALAQQVRGTVGVVNRQPRNRAAGIRAPGNLNRGPAKPPSSILRARTAQNTLDTGNYSPEFALGNPRRCRANNASQLRGYYKLIIRPRLRWRIPGSVSTSRATSAAWETSP